MTKAEKTEPYVGMELKPTAFEVTPKLVSDYIGGLGVEPAEHPPLMVANGADRANNLFFSQMRGHLWLRQEWEFFCPLREGVTYRVEGAVVDIYPHRERSVLLTQTTMCDPSDGAIVSRQRHHQSFLLAQPTGAEVRLRDPKAKEGSGTFTVPVGREIGRLDRVVTLEMCGEFFHGSKNYHSDRKQSEALGFQDVVVGGAMTMGYVGLLLEHGLGPCWAASGRLLVKFTNVLWPEESIVVRAVSRGASAADPTREDVAAWVEKADGTMVIVAEGSVAR